MLPLGGNKLCAGPGGTPGTSLGGRGAALGELEKNWALATAGSAASHKAAATTSWPPRPDLVPPVTMGQGFDRNRGKFMPRASGPIPKFVSARGTLGYELRNLRTTSNSMVLVPLFEPEVRDRICRTVGANFGFGALVPFVSLTGLC